MSILEIYSSLVRKEDMYKCLLIRHLSLLKDPVVVGINWVAHSKE